jgi:predicted ferric reductase
MTTGSLIWYTARASGIVAYLMLAAGVIWGLAFRTRLTRRTSRHAWLLDLHRFLGAGALVFLSVHITSILLDSYVHFGIADVLVPFLGSWNPGAVAWGITAMYLLVALELTSLLRAHLPVRLWRATHYLSFPVFLMATVHGLTAGSDRHSVVARGMYLSAIGAVAILSVRRVVLEGRGGDASAAPAIRGGQPTAAR